MKHLTRDAVGAEARLARNRKIMIDAGGGIKFVIDAHRESTAVHL